MAPLKSVISLALLVAAGASANVLRRGPGLVSLPVHHEEREEPMHIRKRDNSVQLFNRSVIAYMVELNIGTPPQTVRVQLDTGSDELWVNPDCTAVSNPRNAEFCRSVGHFDPSASSTLVDQEQTTELSYGIGDVRLAYVTDNLAIPGSNGMTLRNVVFGVGIESLEAAVPIMGVSYGEGVNLEYPNIIDELQVQGVTQSKAFSIGLGPSSVNNAGRIIFGGMDTKKFTGRLHTFQNLPPQGREVGWRYWVQLDSVGFTKNGAASTYPSSGLPIVIDSGSTYSYLPLAVIQRLASDFGGDIDSDGTVVVPCSVLSQPGSVDFAFGDLKIQVPYAEFIRQIDSTTCIMGAQAADSIPLLGDTFMRSAYVIFDQTNRQISMAPYSDCGTAEQTIPLGGAGNITGQCDPAKPNAASGPMRTSLLVFVALMGVHALMVFL